ncbi:hypothetical protein IWW55_006763 [Coemansia sp. RSA 2706]|nr:hypothetical protein LPJ70_004448 [Coemansia sp. RSA 2708]KAJ2287281.1 hypothetical protein IWW55_006763 [Coemansia sp. RSA 2706]KAJ2304307.1 hypothetical protein IWW52_006625 [Coemansia sp. RSA 2704]KAJ2314268.1 hypothetical protein IWW54_001017 [Coemansia sp. RSA 2705]
MDDDSSYWDQYCGDDGSYVTPLPVASALLVPRMPWHDVSGDGSGSSRDSYWSRYSVQDTADAAGPLRRPQQQTRLLVVPDRLAALHIGASDDDDAPGHDCGSAQPPQSAPMPAPADCGIGSADANARRKTPGSPYTVGFAGVNPLALATRLNFVKDQMKQNERLLMNAAV